MAALQYNLLALASLLISSYAHSNSQNPVIFKNEVMGCFTLVDENLDIDKEPVTVTVSVGAGGKDLDCPCKSALMKFTAYQELETGTSGLLSGYFAAHGKKSVVLPVAVQNQLIFPLAPIRILISCSNSS
jgi:hypothetical protein